MGRLFAPKKPAEPAVTPEPTPPPTAVTKDDLKAMLDGALGGVGQQLGAALGELRQGVEALAARQPQVVVSNPTTIAAPVPITDEEIDQAVASGQNVGARVRALVDRAVTQAADRLMKEHIEPLRNFGVTTLADLSHKVAATGMPKYAKYKKEIDERLGQLSPELRANPEAIKMIHDAVVGSHAEDLEREAAEAAVRKAQEPPPAQTPGTGTAPGAPRTNEIPTLIEVGGQEGLDALKHKGRGNMNQDALAQSMGYKDWNDYQKQYQELLAAESQGNA
jgi:hypothetical protein